MKDFFKKFKSLEPAEKKDIKVESKSKGIFPLDEIEITPDRIEDLYAPGYGAKINIVGRYFNPHTEEEKLYVGMTYPLPKFISSFPDVATLRVFPINPGAENEALVGMGSSIYDFVPIAFDDRYTQAKHTNPMLALLKIPALNSEFSVNVAYNNDNGSPQSSIKLLESNANFKFDNFQSFSVKKDGIYISGGRTDFSTLRNIPLEHRFDQLKDQEL